MKYRVMESDIFTRHRVDMKHEKKAVVLDSIRKNSTKKDGI